MRPLHAKGQSTAEAPGFSGQAAPSVDRAMRGLAGRVGLLAGVTPRNAAGERARLVERFERGERDEPQWEYAPSAHAAPLRREIERLASELAARPDDPMARLYVERLDEMALEAELLEHVGRPSFGTLAARRFPSGGPEADALAHRFLASEPTTSSAERTEATDTRDACSSDGDEPTSLVSRIRALIGRERLAFRVEVRGDLLPLAATGDGIILVAAGRRLTDEAARRTAMHEVMGHALPRARAKAQQLALFEVGTAGGTDDQEGLALTFEHREGFLHGERARELAARHEAVRAMRDGASFSDVVVSTLRAGQSATAAVRIAERTFRGGTGKGAGLGREAVYLPAFLHVSAHLERHPDDERVLTSGQVALRAVPFLRAFAS